MRKLVLVLLLAACAPQSPSAAPETDAARLAQRAQRVTIARDDWGIAHVHGPTDGDAVFGMAYAQGEDDFNRVETNFINSLGRLAEAEGESAIWQDLRMKLFIDPDSMRAMYGRSPVWLQALMDGWADGLNYYLQTHPEVTPRVIRRFEPWMALSFSEGSIGGDIERVDLRQLEAFYDSRSIGAVAAAIGNAAQAEREPGGSNGFAIAPSNSASGNALLLINPHTSFFFRSELQVTSDQGLNAYGAVTWGQFFVYQGFNERLGWMHTSSGVDVVDEFLETVTERNGAFFYRYGDEEREVSTDTITVPYRTGDGGMAERTFVTFRTHHGPIVREQNGRWVAVALMERPIAALQQSFLRTKARTLAEYLEVMQLRANSSNNTVYADADGNIAYLHPQFVPRRAERFDYTKPVDGSDPATDWQGDHALGELPQVINPPAGWIQNTNNWPYSAAAGASPRREDFPRYMDTFGENWRGIHALMVLRGKRDFTLRSLIDAAFDPYLTAFAAMVPPLLTDFDALPASDPRRAELKPQTELLRGWNYHWGVASEATTLAVYWGEELRRIVGSEGVPANADYDYLATSATADQRLRALTAATERLEADFGTWRIAWGGVNRFQRLTGDIVQPFSDTGPSIAVGFTSAQWGSLASFGARSYPGTKKRYGTSGNSFVAAVEFGDSVRALAVTAGGESGDPSSPHFNDQAERYASGKLRPVYYYPGQLVGHTERTYHPGGGREMGGARAGERRP